MNPAQQALYLLRQHGNNLYQAQAQRNIAASDFFAGYLAESPDMNRFNSSLSYNTGNSLANAFPGAMFIGAIGKGAKTQREIEMAREILGNVPASTKWSNEMRLLNQIKKNKEFADELNLKRYFPENIDVAKKAQSIVDLVADPNNPNKLRRQ